MSVAGLAACGSPVNNPVCGQCPVGTHCAANGCVADDTVVDLTMTMAIRDLTVTCAEACIAPRAHCGPGQKCVACLADVDCPAGQICHAGSFSCIPGCNDDARCAAGGNAAMKCCGGQCLDTSQDGLNCGACGTPCAGPHAYGACKDSACTLGACMSGWANCNGDSKDGCEINQHVDPQNCGGCGKACAFKNSIAACADTCYLAACNFGYDDCNGAPMDGCETSVLTDVKNCGSCGKLCNAPAHAKAACVNSGCLISLCDQGWLDCDKSFVNGCEVNGFGDAKNCGACGSACPNGLVCINGGCTCQQCNFANAQSTCVNQQCVMGACNAGFGDCNNDPKDGCEINFNSDNGNCGACKAPCPMNNPTCVAGMCSNSIHNTVAWQNFNTANNSCNMSQNGVVIGNYQWLNLGPMTWKNCMRESSKRGAQTRAPSYGMWALPGWFGHRNPTSALAMIGQWSNYITADISTNQNCVALVDPQSVILKVWNTVQLASTTTYDGNTWHYQDYGVKWIDECELLAGKAGASIITPATIGLGTGDGYWLGVLHTCSVYAWSVNGTTFSYDNTVVRTSQKSCLVGYIDN